MQAASEQRALEISDASSRKYHPKGSDVVQIGFEDVYPKSLRGIRARYGDYHLELPRDEISKQSKFLDVLSIWVQLMTLLGSRAEPEAESSEDKKQKESAASQAYGRATIGTLPMHSPSLLHAIAPYPPLQRRAGE